MKASTNYCTTRALLLHAIMIHTATAFCGVGIGIGGARYSQLNLKHNPNPKQIVFQNEPCHCHHRYSRPGFALLDSLSSSDADVDVDVDVGVDKSDLSGEKQVQVGEMKIVMEASSSSSLTNNNVNGDGNNISTSTSTSTISSTFSSNEEDLLEETSAMSPSGLFWRGVVLILCALWASNFAVVKLILAEPNVDSSLYTVSRFTVAALALIPGFIAAVRRGVIDWDTARGAAVCGSWVAFGYLGQAIGLLTTTASRSCVICTLHCVFVAVIAEFMRVSNVKSTLTLASDANANGDANGDANANGDAAKKDSGEQRTFDIRRIIPAAIAVIGVAIVELKGAGGAPTIGDALSFAQPIGFGMGYLQLEELVRKKPQAGLPISAIKLIMVALFSYGMFEFSPLLHNEAFVPRFPDFTPILSSPLALLGILYTGLITTALSLWVESIAFKRVPATDASIILTTEPLFAAGLGAVTLGETFVFSDYVGATLIMGACAAAILLGEEDSEEQELEVYQQ